MAGLGNPQGAMPQQAQQQPAMGGQEQATPEEQAQLEQFAQIGADIIYADPGKVDPEIEKNLKGQFDPQALAMFEAVEPPLTDSPQDALSATAVLVTVIAESMLEVSDEVAMEGGRTFFEVLLETSEAMGLHEFTPEEQDGAWYRAVDLYRYASKRIDPEALKAAFGELVEADKAGKLGEVLPGLPGGKPMGPA